MTTSEERAGKALVGARRLRWVAASAGGWWLFAVFSGSRLDAWIVAALSLAGGIGILVWMASIVRQGPEPAPVPGPLLGASVAFLGGFGLVWLRSPLGASWVGANSETGWGALWLGGYVFVFLAAVTLVGTAGFVVTVLRLASLWESAYGGLPRGSGRSTRDPKGPSDV